MTEPVTVSVRSRPVSYEVVIVLDAKEVTREKVRQIQEGLAGLCGSQLRNRAIELSTRGGNFALVVALTHTLGASSFDYYLDLEACAHVISQVLSSQPITLREDSEHELRARMIKRINELLGVMRQLSDQPSLR